MKSFRKETITFAWPRLRATSAGSWPGNRAATIDERSSSPRGEMICALRASSPCISASPRLLLWAKILSTPISTDRPYAEALTRRKPQTKPSTASTPPTTQALEIAPAGLSEVDQKSFAIHLASLRTKDGAKVGWKNLQSQFPELLDQRELIVRSIDLEGQGTFFRVMTGPFQDRTGAQDLCAEFKAFEQYCTVKLVQ